MKNKEIKNFNLDMTPAAPIQFLFLCRFDNSDEEIPVRILRDFVDEYVSIGPQADKFFGDSFKEVVQCHSVPPPFMR